MDDGELLTMYTVLHRSARVVLASSPLKVHHGHAHLLQGAFSDFPIVHIRKLNAQILATGSEHFNLQRAGLSRTLSRRPNPANCRLGVQSETPHFYEHFLESCYALSSFTYNVSNLHQS